MCFLNNRYPKKLRACELHVPTYSLERFDRQKPDLLVAEASDLGVRVPLHRFFNDACDVGIAIRSHKTGREVRFLFTHEDKTPDGDIAGWNFEAYDKDQPIKRVLIIND